MAQISLRIDDDVKKNAETTLDEIGLSMSTAITIFLKTVVREQPHPLRIDRRSFFFQIKYGALEQRGEQN